MIECTHEKRNHAEPKSKIVCFDDRIYQKKSVYRLHLLSSHRVCAPFICIDNDLIRMDFIGFYLLFSPGRSLIQNKLCEQFIYVFHFK